MRNMNRAPHEAVDAALELVPPHARPHLEWGDMRRILEAAAPHMLAEAWDEGAEAEYERDYSLGDEITNPYRSQGVTKVEAMDDALRMYGEGVALAVITERTGISYSGLMKAKKDRGIPDRPQRADGTDRSQA